MLSVQADLDLTVQPDESPEKKQKWQRFPLWAIILVGAVILLGLTGGIWFALHPREAAEQEQQAAEAEGRSESAGSEWQTVDFIMPNPGSWKVEEDNYIALAQHDSDSFAWSRDVYEGDMTLSLDLHSAEEAIDLNRDEMENHFPSLNSGCVILYGNGQEFSDGSLIFCVDWDGYYLEKDSRYSNQDPLVFIPIRSFNKPSQVYRVKIEIIDDLVVIQVNDQEVLSAILDQDEINHSGRIGLFRNWSDGEITFSNIRAKSPIESGE
jgi:hypothetical protein